MRLRELLIASSLAVLPLSCAIPTDTAFELDGTWDGTVDGVALVLDLTQTLDAVEGSGTRNGVTVAVIGTFENSVATLEITPSGATAFVFVGDLGTASGGAKQLEGVSNGGGYTNAPTVVVKQ